MDWIRDNLWQSWLILAVAMGLIEIVSLDLIFAMLAGGALVGLVAALFNAGLTVSLCLALVTSVALLALLRPNLIKAIHSGPDLKIGQQVLIGKRATVLTDVGYDRPGRIKVNGEDWQALPYDERDAFSAGDVVEVVEISGVTAKVLRLPTLETPPHTSG